MILTRRALLRTGSAAAAVGLAPSLSSFAYADEGAVAARRSLEEVRRQFDEALRDAPVPEGVELLRQDVLAYLDAPSPRSGPVPLGLANSAIAASVGLIYLWFYGKGYLLAAELISHARSNKTAGSLYYPTQMNVGPLSRSNTIKKLRSGSASSGSSRFVPSSASIVDTDGYYAMNKFSYSKVTVGGVKKIRLRDTYDYADKSHYDGIEGAAVKVMYEAQRRGVIKIFKLDLRL